MLRKKWALPDLWENETINRVKHEQEDTTEIFT